eukprot:TRINITY_DN3649_c0_g1_i1.p1 TRINITY_DN3649_c0_g1~~TRINITY_DN3649_c0_g1_i1.p1  ORF type:complete len:149 (+),score=59.05 TRINITY_DN3649_c0_g1_i1:43-447(+)
MNRSGRSQTVISHPTSTSPSSSFASEAPPFGASSSSDTKSHLVSPRQAPKSRALPATSSASSSSSPSSPPHSSSTQVPEKPMRPARSFTTVPGEGPPPIAQKPPSSTSLNRLQSPPPTPAKPRPLPEAPASSDS